MLFQRVVKPLAEFGGFEGEAALPDIASGIQEQGLVDNADVEEPAGTVAVDVEGEPASTQKLGLLAHGPPAPAAPWDADAFHPIAP